MAVLSAQPTERTLMDMTLREWIVIRDMVIAHEVEYGSNEETAAIRSKVEVVIDARRNEVASIWN